MQSGLSIKFNHKAIKEIKTEDDLKVGKRKRADGSLMWVRGGKVVGETPASMNEVILNELRHAATEAVAKQNKVAQEHHKPSSVTAERPPRL